MQVRGKVTVVTGGGNGIGKALCERFAAEGARAVVVADYDTAGAESVAKSIGGLAVPCDVAKEADVKKLIDLTVQKYAQINVFCSNAGIGVPGGAEAPNAEWQRIWEINLMGHVYAARYLVPLMLEQGDGYLVNTASAAGLLTQIGSAPYSVTKHAAVSFAEWLSITYGPAIKVSCLCPQGVRTQMLMGKPEGTSAAADFLRAGSVSPEEVAEAVVRGMETEQFLILPHPIVKEYYSRKATDYDRWIRGMRRLQAEMAAGTAKEKAPAN